MTLGHAVAPTALRTSKPVRPGIWMSSSKSSGCSCSICETAATPEPVAEPGEHHRQVVLGVGALLGEAPGRGRSAGEARAQHVAEVGEQAIGACQVDVHDGADRVEGVEQEVRIELADERPQL